MTKNEIARLVHKDFFDKCRNAIDNGFYLEALCMEYNAIESRAIVIMKLLEMPCGIYKDDIKAHSIGLATKLLCIRDFMDDETIFSKTKLYSDKYQKPEKYISKMRDWCESRNQRIHRLYDDVEKYDKIMANSRIIAIEGYDYAYTMYKEANRLKGLYKKHPEFFERKHCECKASKGTCMDLINKFSK